MRPLWIALQFLTCIPVPRSAAGHESDDEAHGQAVLFYPLVGLLLGGALAGLAWFLQGQSLPLQAALLLALWVLLTGALHLDGLADSADGWMGGLGDRQRTLEIMKDSCSGAIAVVTVVLLLLLKFAALVTLLESQPLEYLLFVPLVARTAVIVLLLTTPYVRSDGIASRWVGAIPELPAWLVVLVATLSVLLLSWQGVVALWVALLGLLLLRWLMVRRLGGMTGDTAGAMIELLELAVLVSMAWRL